MVQLNETTYDCEGEKEMESMKELNLEKLANVTGGQLINVGALEAYIKGQKESGSNLNRILSVLLREPTIHNYTNDLDIYGVIEYTTNYYNSLPGAQGAFIDGEVVDL